MASILQSALRIIQSNAHGGMTPKLLFPVPMLLFLRTSNGLRLRFKWLSANESVAHGHTVRGRDGTAHWQLKISLGLAIRFRKKTS